MDRLKFPHVTHVADIRQFPWPFSDNSLDEVLAIHVWEHVTVGVGKMLLKETHRILRPNGKCRVHVPSRKAVFEKFNSPNLTMKERITLNEIMYGLELWLDSEWQHKALYDFELLGESFRETGFRDIKDVTDVYDDRHDEGWKWIVNKLSLKVEGVK